MRKTLSFLLAFCMIFPLFCFGAPGAKVKALGENLALGKPSYASSEDDNKKEGAFDGNMGTRWSSAAEKDVSGNLTLQNAYIEVDFGEAITFDSIVVNECTNWGKIKSYSAQYYLEGQGWRECYAGGPTTTDEVLTFPAVVGSRFRLTDFEMESGITVTIWEIGVYCASEQLVANLAVASADATSVTLTWDGDGYELCELISGQSYGAAASPYTVDGLSPGQDLAFILKKDGKQTAPLSTQTLTNLAAQKSYSGTGTVQNAFDGDIGTAWNAGSETDYLEVNFGTPLTFNRVVATGLTADSVTISCADEADNWTICYIGSAADGQEIVLPRNFTANKIKLSNITPAGRVGERARGLQ